MCGVGFHTTGSPACPENSHMPKTPGKMHMYDMVKIDTIVFEIVGGSFKAPTRIVSCLK